MIAKEMQVSDILSENFLPYAYSTIEDRAIPAIDGLKPVARKILYTMHLMRLYGKKTKSANIVGQTMRLHPHGDSSIYEAMAKITTGHEALLAPYVESKGSFNKVYSRDMACAASRYTEAGLAEISKEMLDNLDEDAVDFIDNYDGTMKEPVILPVKFPSVLVNAVPGIAVGMASAIPTYNLKEVCEATIGIIKGEVTNSEELFKVLRAPDFTTKGVINCSDKELLNLIKTGRETITISGKYRIEKNIVNITEIPYRAYMEDIRDTIIDGIRNKTFTEINGVVDTTGIDGFGLQIEFKTRGADGYIEHAMAKIMYLTQLRNKVHFQTNVLIDGRPESLGVYELLTKWIEFREHTVQRIYKFRLNKKREQEHLLKVWDIAKGRYKEILNVITDYTEVAAKEKLMNDFGFDNIQVEYIFDMKSRQFTKEKEAKKLEELKKIEDECKKYDDIANNIGSRYNVIIDELTEIAKKYGKHRLTEIGEPVETRKEQAKELKKAKEFKVYMAVTPTGYVVKYDNVTGLSSYLSKYSNVFDNRFEAFECSNIDTLLIFKASGDIYKIPVDDIAVNSNKLFNINNEYEDNSTIIYVDTTRDYQDSCCVIDCDNLRCTLIPYTRLMSNRIKSKTVYEPISNVARCAVIKDNRFFMVTSGKKVRYMELNSEFAIASGRVYVYSIGKINAGEKLVGILERRNASSKITAEEIEMYSKPYFVKLKTKILEE